VRTTDTTPGPACRPAPAPRRLARKGMQGVVALWLAAALTACSDDPGGGAPTPTATPPAHADSTGNTPATGEPTEAAGVAAERAEQTVHAWLVALREGDADRMATLLGAASLAAAPGLRDAERVPSELAEGMAAFADADDWSVVQVPGRDGTYLVVASGEITREGMTERDARAWFVHPADGDPRVEAFTEILPEVVAPTRGAPHSADAPVEMVLPGAGAGAAVLAMADGKNASARSATEPAAGRVRVTLPPPRGGWAAGEHVVAAGVAPADADDPWPATAVAFTVG
jgi:hypothetical protein